MIGTTLAHYNITSHLGAGGMGEVYQATDTKLARNVAVKFLPEVFARDSERVSRFEREARLLASLNHPNIAAIYGLEDAGDKKFLVMELVPGETLADRIARGAIPLEESVAIARQIVDALEAAHEKGVIHRDLKPANIKITEDGTIKVLDFGLAKAYGQSAEDISHSNSPTLSVQATEQGVILGTAAYMAPEQARGKTVDKRADIWAFGVLLFEMLIGRKLFSGDTLSDTLAAVLTREPDWTMLPASTSPGVRRLLTRCLERDPKTRLRDIGDARVELEDLNSATGSAAVQQSSLFRLLPWGLAAALLLFAGWAFWSRPGSAGIVRDVTSLDIAFPPNVEPVNIASIGQVAPDGRTVAMIAAKDGVRWLFVRELDHTEFRQVPGTSGVNTVTFSPDSRSLAFVPASGEITLVSLIDQQRRVLTGSADITMRLAWSPAGIVFGRAGALWIVPEAGGEPRRLTTLDAARGEVLHDHPVVLPGQRFVLFSSLTTRAGTEQIEAVPIDGGSRSVVVERAMSPVWSPTNHLILARDGALLAVALNPQTATVQGEAVPILVSEKVATSLTGGLVLSLSDTGTLVYAPDGFLEKNVLSVGRDGGTMNLGLPPGTYANPRISPDERQLLVEAQAGSIETLDLIRKTRAQLTAAAFGTSFSSWNSDGKRIAVRRFNSPSWLAANGSGESALLPQAAANDFPSSAGPDPDSVIVVRIEPETSGDIYLLSMSGAFEPRPLLATPAYDGGPQLSPDGHWLLYQSNPSGQAEIFVRRYPALDRPYPVSAGGGVQGRWSRNGREIYYRNGQRMVAVSVDTSGAEPVFGTPTALFTDEYDFGAGISIPNYDVTSDGRFIMLRRGPNGGNLRVVLNWTEELKQILETNGK